MDSKEAVQEVKQAVDQTAGPKPGGFNIVICFDGTANEFGGVNTNVVRLAQVLDRTPGKQRLYYDPGVGTLADPGAWGVIAKWTSKIAGLAFGAGLDRNVQEAYTYLMDFWNPGDRVYIFGFSRGAYSARVLAGMLYAIGLLPRGGYNLVPYAMRLYRAIRSERSKQVLAGMDSDKGEWTKLCDEFRWTFSRMTKANDQVRRFPVQFLGLWDTVSSVGWAWDPAKFPHTARNPGVSVVRHAISINERRWFFRQNEMKAADPAKLLVQARQQNVLEMWFAGVHCDVGGGYEAQLGGKPAELWREPFAWMLVEAKEAGLLIDDSRLPHVMGDTPMSDPRPWSDLAHESLTRVWWLAEFFPKQVWDSKKRASTWKVGLGRTRPIPDGAWIHQSVLKRLRDGSLNYNPLNLSKQFIQEVQSLPEVPEKMRYWPAGTPASQTHGAKTGA